MVRESVEADEAVREYVEANEVVRECVEANEVVRESVESNEVVRESAKEVWCVCLQQDTFADFEKMTDKLVEEILFHMEMYSSQVTRIR